MPVEDGQHSDTLLFKKKKIYVLQLAEYSHQHLLRASQRRQQAIEKIRQEYYMSTSSEATSQVYLFHRVQQIFTST